MFSKPPKKDPEKEGILATIRIRSTVATMVSYARDYECRRGEALTSFYDHCLHIGALIWDHANGQTNNIRISGPGFIPSDALTPGRKLTVFVWLTNKTLVEIGYISGRRLKQRHLNTLLSLGANAILIGGGHRKITLKCGASATPVELTWNYAA